jgi:hypothetical protein
MSRTRYPLPFTPHAEFRAVKRLSLNGIKYNPGEDIDKATIPIRLLEVLYRGRRIEPRPADGSSDHPIYVRTPLTPKPLTPAERKKRIDRASISTVNMTTDTLVSTSRKVAKTASTVPAPEILTGRRAVHTSFGKFDIFEADGTTLYATGVKTKQLAHDVANGDVEIPDGCRPKHPEPVTE